MLGPNVRLRAGNYGSNRSLADLLADPKVKPLLDLLEEEHKAMLRIDALAADKYDILLNKKKLIATSEYQEARTSKAFKTINKDQGIIFWLSCLTLDLHDRAAVALAEEASMDEDDEEDEAVPSLLAPELELRKYAGEPRYLSNDNAY